MSNKIIKVSKEDILEFARTIYRQAISGYSDLEDPVCLSEVNRFFEAYKEEPLFPPTTVFSSTGSITYTASSYGALPHDSYFVGCNPYFDCTVQSQTIVSNEGFSSPDNPTEQQLLLFDELDSSNEGSCNDRLESCDPRQDFDSNEGHIFF